MKILITGAAGFIGFHLCKKLISLGHTIFGIDNVNDYYSMQLKYDRLNELGIHMDPTSEWNTVFKSSVFSNFVFYKADLTNREFFDTLFRDEKFDVVCNLAAQAGVRYSLENPFEYVTSNIYGFLNILECCRHHHVKKMVYASSSSVYGKNSTIPYSTDENTNNPVSLYAASKMSNELMAHSYSHLFNFQTIGLRFFTVYGPWGRPDMAMFLFTDAIFKKEPVKVFNNGNLSRDFTYVDDIIDGITKVLFQDAKENKALCQVYNIGNGKPVQLLDFIKEIEKNVGLEARKQMLPMQLGDVYQTWADTSDLEVNFNYKPGTSIHTGVKNYVHWFKEYYKP